MPNATDELEIREYREEDESACLELRNRVFPPISVSDWRRGSTAAVAYLDGRLVGVIPFMLRSFALRRDLNVVAAVANSVAVSEECRGRGVGTRMMSSAAEFLQDRADATMVYTGDEVAGRPYRFYRLTGHVDMAYPVRYRLRQAGGQSPGFTAEVSGVDVIGQVEDELIEVFEARWGDCGGHVRRERGFHRRALSSHIFVECPYEEMFLVRVSKKERLNAYAIAGLGQGHLTVLEWAWTSTHAEAALVTELHQFGASRRAGVAVWSCQALPGSFGSPDAEWERDGRDAVIVGQVINPHRIFARLASQDMNGGLPRLNVWTPERKWVLNAEGIGSVAIEMKEWQLHQMLFCRSSLEDEVRFQRVTASEGTWEQIGQLSRVFQTAAWEYHHLDYI